MSSVSFGEDPGLEEVLTLFQDLSKVSRLSGHEEPIVRWIEQFYRDRFSRWGSSGSSLSFSKDKFGNILIRVPGTQRLVNTPFVAIQAHVDMYGATTLGENSEEIFKNGVQVVRDGNLLHSLRYETSLGADNGIGVALALRYLQNPDLEHPPLELIFTVGEELDEMPGARNFNFPLSSRYLINLDAEDEEQAYYSCQGYASGKIYCSLPAASHSDSASGTEGKVIVVQLQGLRGGHSGVFAHENRSNSVLLMARFLKEVFLGSGSEVRPQDVLLLSAQGGNLDISSNVPESFEVRLKVPEKSVEIQGKIETYLRKLKADLNTRKKELGVEVRISSVPLTDDTTGIAISDFSPILDNLVAFEPLNGVNARERGQEYPADVRTSTNLAGLSLLPEANHGKVKMNLLIRSYSPTEQREVYDKAVQVLTSSLSRQAGEYADVPGWDSNPQSLMVRLLRGISQKIKIVKAPGVIEPAFLVSKVKEMEAVSIGPTIQDPHTVREIVFIDSIGRTCLTLDQFLILLGEHACAALLEGK